MMDFVFVHNVGINDSRAALVKAELHIDHEQAVAQIKDIVGWV